MKHTRRYVLGVIVPVYKGLAWIESCVNSFKAQTLSPENFEVTFIFNGEDDGGRELLERLLRNEPTIPARILHSETRGAAAARNFGLQHSSATHVTWVDVDDVLSPQYLELLHSAISPGVVPAALLVDLTADEAVDATGVIAQDFLSHTTPYIDVTAAPRLLTYTVGKVLPVEWLRETAFSEQLESGEDVALFGTLVLKHNFRISLWPGMAGAIYYRRRVAGSVSQKLPGRDFMVRQRCDVIEVLSNALKDSAVVANEGVVRGYMNSQASFIRRYLESNPEERQSVMDELTIRKIHHFPWRIVAGTPKDLVVAYNFAPYTDTGATIVSKRIRDRARPVDVISNNMGKLREALPENLMVAAPYIVQHRELSTPPQFANPAGTRMFVEQGIKAYESLVSAGRTYEHLYSRSMWPASHFLAAKIKLADPSLFWTAEFSDPVRLTTEGSMRTVDLAGSGLVEAFPELVGQDQSQVLFDNQDLYAWTELLPYLMADELVFTNHHQLESMLEYAPLELQAVVRSKAVVSVHPTLSREFYSVGRPAVPPAGKINIGYFGDFYSTRGLQEVLQAIESLTEVERDRLSMSIFTSKASDDLEVAASGSLKSVLRTGPRVSFLDFLATLDEFDVLIVNDAITTDTHARNPYLPSKLSDYRGSKAKIWAIAEPGSSLSEFVASFHSTRGSVEEARQVLSTIAALGASRDYSGSASRR